MKYKPQTETQIHRIEQHLYQLTFLIERNGNRGEILQTVTDLTEELESLKNYVSLEEGPED